MTTQAQATAAPMAERPKLTKRTISDALAALDQASRPAQATLQATKKRKTSAPRPAPTSTPALEALLAQARPRSTPSTADVPASYDPTSLGLLLARLSTYRLSSYSPGKPATLSPLVGAVNGWVNKDQRDRVECVTCRKGVVLLPPSATATWSSPSGQALARTYESLLSGVGSDDAASQKDGGRLGGTGHAETCPWRMRPCSRSVYKLEGGGIGIAGGGGRKKLLEVVARQAGEMQERGIGQVELDLPEGIRTALGDKGTADKLVKSVSAHLPAPASREEHNVEADDGTSRSNSEIPTVSIPTVLLSIFGWSLDPLTLPAPVPSLEKPPLVRSSSSSSSLSSLAKSSSPILSCAYCLRQVLAAPYIPAPTGTATPTFAGSPSSRIAGSNSTTGAKKFNPVSQHQRYCPFVDAYGGLPPPTSTPSSTSHGADRPSNTVASASAAARPRQRLLKPGYQTRFDLVVQIDRPAHHALLGVGTDVLDDPSMPPRAVGARQGGSEPLASPDARREGSATVRTTGAKTRELVNYVRTLLGPAPKPASPAPIVQRTPSATTRTDPTSPPSLA
ncbi:hypothetical protein JCM10212_005078 [Sporobolomyces blumeae]